MQQNVTELKPDDPLVNHQNHHLEQVQAFTQGIDQNVN